MCLADVDVPRRGGENDGAVGQLLLAPAIGPTVERVGVDPGRSVPDFSGSISRGRAPEPDVRLSPHPALHRSRRDG